VSLRKRGRYSQAAGRRGRSLINPRRGRYRQGGGEIDFGTAFANPDFVKLAEGFGIPGWRRGSADEFGERLGNALTLDLPSLIALPIDYSIDVAISEELGAETVAT
jgi:thiamine pyrophosphate-dependent acetolactate synthase large subunit-like protein